MSNLDIVLHRQLWQLQQERAKLQFTIARLQLDRDRLRQQLHDAASKIADLLSQKVV